jgi:hypothetical protein
VLMRLLYIARLLRAFRFSDLATIARRLPNSVILILRAAFGKAVSSADRVRFFPSYFISIDPERKANRPPFAAMIRTHYYFGRHGNSSSTASIVCARPFRHDLPQP